MSIRRRLILVIYFEWFLYARHARAARVTTFTACPLEHGNLANSLSLHPHSTGALMGKRDPRSGHGGRESPASPQRGLELLGEITPPDWSGSRVRARNSEKNWDVVW